MNYKQLEKQFFHDYDVDLQYRALVKRILEEGVERNNDRTGKGTLSVFDAKMKFDLREAFPLVSCKETRYKVAFLEMLWFLRGEDNTKFLNANGSTLWDAWADKYGNLGEVYGVQWRSWRDGEYFTIDQIDEMLSELVNNPQSRRHIVSAWNVSDLGDMALAPCHWAHQCYVDNEGFLSMKVFQRSWDVGLGNPFNIAQYALLLHMYARHCNLKPSFLIFDAGDVHIYKDHIDKLKEVIERPIIKQQPQIKFLTDSTDIDSYTKDDFEITGYTFHPFVKLPVSV